MSSESRLLSLLARLGTGRSFTATDLAAEFGVTERTIRRDIATLRELGYTVDAAPGVDGGYRAGGRTVLAAPSTRIWGGLRDRARSITPRRCGPRKCGHRLGERETRGDAPGRGRLRGEGRSGPRSPSPPATSPTSTMPRSGPSPQRSPPAVASPSPTRSRGPTPRRPSDGSNPPSSSCLALIGTSTRGISTAPTGGSSASTG